MTIARTSALLLAILSLVACSGSSTAPDEGYAQPDSNIQGDSSFATQDVTRLVHSYHTVKLKPQTITMSISRDGETVYINQNHKDFALTYNPTTGRYEDISSGYAAFLSREYVATNTVETVYFGVYEPSTHSTNYLNDGYFVVGYKTNPVQIDALTGSAIFNGHTDLEMRTDTRHGYGHGAVSLTANFDTNTIGGVMKVINSGKLNAQFTMPNTSFAVTPTNATNITGNQFSASMTATVTPTPGINMTINPTTMNGHFYGSGGTGIGATFAGTGTLDGETLFFQGALAAAK